jgi:hypothetical protein
VIAQLELVRHAQLLQEADQGQHVVPEVWALPPAVEVYARRGIG